MRTRIFELLEKLRLKGMANILDEKLAQAETEGFSYQKILHYLLEAELIHQEEKKRENRFKRANLLLPWTLQTFPFDKQPSINKSQIYSLASLDFVERKENIVFIGEPGTGKTGLAIGIIQNALANGMNCRCYTAQNLLDELYSSLADRSTPKLQKKLARYDLLLIDELGYLTLKPEQCNAFFKLISDRYGKRSTLITTNLDYPDWYDLFQRKPLVDAMLDRIKHHCITIRTKGLTLRHTDGDE